jgi:hypothetical protein
MLHDSDKTASDKPGAAHNRWTKQNFSQSVMIQDAP